MKSEIVYQLTLKPTLVFRVFVMLLGLAVNRWSWVALGFVLGATSQYWLMWWVR